MEQNLQTEMRNHEEGKIIWIKDIEKAFILAKVEAEEADSYIVVTKQGDRKKVLPADTYKPNPQKFDAIDDLAGLSNLNEATVLDNLRKRYDLQLIYTYSGLFLVAMNPFKNLGIYTERYMKKYSASKKYELNPHIYAVANDAYSSMLINRKNQSILITGESGAGKTENTKRAISFLAYVAHGYNSNEQVTIEDKIINTNPILEAFGNAQTTRNYNSSRFGKFIKISFESGRITGATIEKYLLERSRVTKPNKDERNYHIFYQLLKSNREKLLTELHLTNDIQKYKILENTPLNVPGIDDTKEFQTTLDCMRSVGFTEILINNVLNIVSAILHLGNIEFIEKNEKVEILHLEPVETACKLLSIPFTNFIKNILSPISILSKESIMRFRNIEQAQKIVDGFCRLLYENLFDEIIRLINKFIRSPLGDSFIGVLDIAGFEIFEKNNFEQFCINYTNEKLQQFFNHHMFILEQDIYSKEKIEWNYIDFGHDLSPTINLIESNNPIGIMAYIDEECLMPKGNEENLMLKFAQKLEKERFLPSKFTKGFTLKHYAGYTDYEIDGWLEKNKEPFFENVFELIHNSDNEFVSRLVLKPSKNEKKGFFRTVAQKHKEQLASLMNELRNTSPHFVRCILPNISKRSDMFESNFILHQLRCNGVLEGIRISRLGYPNRMFFDEFIQRYQVIYKVFDGKDEKLYIKEMCEEFGISEKSYKLGVTKVFFKQGILAEMEEIRERKQAELMRELCAQVKAFFVRKNMLVTERKRDAIKSLCSDFNRHLQLRKFGWWRLYQIVKPLLDVTKKYEVQKEQTEKLEEYQQSIKNLQEEIKKMKRVLQSKEYEKGELNTVIQQEKLHSGQLEELITALRTEKQNILLELSKSTKQIQNMSGQNAKLEKNYDEKSKLLQEAESKNMKHSNQITDLQKFLDQTNKKLDDSIAQNKSILAENKQLKSEMDALKVKNASKLEQLVIQKDKELIDLNEKISALEDSILLQTEKVDESVIIEKSLREDLVNLQNKLCIESTRIEKVEAQKERLEANIAQVTDINANLQHKYESICKQLQNTQKALNKCKCENEDYVVQVQRAEDEIQKSNSDLRACEKERDIIRESVAMEQDKCKNLEMQIDILKKENEALINSNELVNPSLEAEMKGLQEKIIRLEKNNKKLQDTIKTEKEFYQLSEKERTENQKKNHERNQQELEKVLKEVSIVNSERKALNLKIKKLENENSSLKSALDERIQNEESTGSSECSPSLEAERMIRDELREQLAVKETENLRLKNEYEALQEKFDTEITESHRVINELKDKSNKRVDASELAMFKKDIKAYRKSVSDSFALYQKMYQDRMMKYRNEISTLEEQLKNCQNENSEYKRKIAECELLVNSECNKSKSMQSNLDFYKKHSEEQSVRLREKDTECFKKQNELAELRTKLTNLQINNDFKFKISNEKINELQNTIIEKSDQIGELNQQIQYYSENYEKLHDLIKESEEEKILRINNANLTKELDQYKIEHNTLKNEIQQYREQVGKCDEVIFDLKNKMTTTKKQNELLHSQIECKDQEVKNWKTQYLHVNKELNDISSKEIQFPKFVKHETQDQFKPIIEHDNILTFENEELKRKLNEKNVQYEKQTDEYAVLKKEYQNSKKDNEALTLRVRQLKRELEDEKDCTKMIRVMRNMKRKGDTK